MADIHERMKRTAYGIASAVIFAVILAAAAFLALVF